MPRSAHPLDRVPRGRRGSRSRWLGSNGGPRAGPAPWRRPSRRSADAGRGRGRRAPRPAELRRRRSRRRRARRRARGRLRRACPARKARPGPRAAALSHVTGRRGRVVGSSLRLLVAMRRRPVRALSVLHREQQPDVGGQQADKRRRHGPRDAQRRHETMRSVIAIASSRNVKTWRRRSRARARCRSAGPMNRTPLRGVMIQRPSVLQSPPAPTAPSRVRTPRRTMGCRRLALGSKNAAHMMPKTARGNHSTPSLPWGRRTCGATTSGSKRDASTTSWGKRSHRCDSENFSQAGRSAIPRSSQVRRPVDRRSTTRTATCPPMPRARPRLSSPAT